MAGYTESGDRGQGEEKERGEREPERMDRNRGERERKRENLVEVLLFFFMVLAI